LGEKLDGVDQTVEGMRNAVDNWKNVSNYIRMISYEGRPCIEIGNLGDYNTLITNSYIKTGDVDINNEFVQRNDSVDGYYVWKVRSNGNYGLQWKGG
jgi:hypothetical protein